MTAGDTVVTDAGAGDADRHAAILGRYAPPDEGDHVAIHLLNFPLRVFAAARQHHDELMREFALLALRPPQDRPGHTVPRELLDLIETLGRRYANVGDRADAARDEALERGDRVIDLTYVVPRSVGPAMSDLHDLMSRAYQFCREGELLTLEEAPVEHDFRVWFTEEFINQAGGHPPRPWSGPLEPSS